MDRLALKDVMSREFVGVSESDDLLDAVAVMRSEDASSAVVLRGDAPVGLVTAETVLDLLVDGGDADSAAVEDAMEAAPPALSPGASIADAADLMGRTGGASVLVADDDGVHGLVEARDLASAVNGRSGQSSPTAASEPADPDADSETMSAVTATSEGYSAQSICEACGGLARELANVNGQLLCPDCRSV